MLLLLLPVACSVLDPPPAATALEAAPSAERQVWLFRMGADGVFVRDPEPVAHSLSSLGAGVIDGELVVTGLCWWEACGSMWRRDLWGPPVHAIVTDDLETWQARQWRLDDPEDRVPIDPQVSSGEDGPELWYYAVPSDLRGDPALIRQAHSLRRAVCDGADCDYVSEVATGPMLADPAPVRFRGETMLFATSQPAREIALFSGAPMKQQRTWSGVSVPHAQVVGEELWLWASRIEGGRTRAVRARSKDGRSWGPWESPLPTEGLEHCASPVGAALNGQLVALCVDEPLQPRGGPAGAAGPAPGEVGPP